MRTNCDNCGAALVEGKCEYCGTTWFKPGLHIGDHAYMSKASMTMHILHAGAGRSADGQMHIGKSHIEYEVELNIIGLTQEEVKRLFDSIQGGLGPIDLPGGN